MSENKKNVENCKKNFTVDIFNSTALMRYQNFNLVTISMIEVNERTNDSQNDNSK